MAVPFSRFEGRLKQLHVAEFADVFDLFFPFFRTEQAKSTFVTRGRGRIFFGDVALAGDSSTFHGRGRERRYAGGASLPRKRYHCIADSARNAPANNTLLRELFAYADPRMTLMPELIDSTVDADAARHLCERMEWDFAEPAVFHIVPARESAWFLPPVLGIPQAGAVLRYPLSLSDHVIERCVDLRRPRTLQWAFETFTEMEMAHEGAYKVDDNVVVCRKSGRPEGPSEFLAALLAQSTGGGSPFLQGIGNFLRAHGAEALIYPSARADSLSIVQSGHVVESYGYVLVDFRDAPEVAFEPEKYFGILPAWRERLLRSVTMSASEAAGDGEVRVSGLRRIQETRFAVFADWSKNSLARARVELRDRATTLTAPVELALRKPSDIVGPAGADVLGGDQEFLIDEGGPATGFLVEWRVGGTGAFLCDVLPAAASPHWLHDKWSWSSKVWFLFRACRVAPWALLKCPACLNETFWIVGGEEPAKACAACGLTHSEAGRNNDISEFIQWASTFKENDPSAEGAETLVQAYADVCHQCMDAVTGRVPPTQPKAVSAINRLYSGFAESPGWWLEKTKVPASRSILSRLGLFKAQRAILERGCPRCEFVTTDDIAAPACPGCGYKKGAPAKPPVPASESEVGVRNTLPRDFLVHFTTAVIAVMNQPTVRDAVARIDPKGSGALRAYAELFGRAIPSAPALSDEDMSEIAKELRSKILDRDGRPVTVEEREVFQLLCRILGGQV